MPVQAKDVLDLSATLSDVEKGITEYWADGPGQSVQPPGHWMQFAADAALQKVGELDVFAWQWLSIFIIISNDVTCSVCCTVQGLNRSESIKLLFGIASTLFDAGIAAWAEKRFYDSIRPLQMIQCLHADQMVRFFASLN